MAVAESAHRLVALGAVQERAARTDIQTMPAAKAVKHVVSVQLADPASPGNVPYAPQSVRTSARESPMDAGEHAQPTSVRAAALEEPAS